MALVLSSLVLKVSLQQNEGKDDILGHVDKRALVLKFRKFQIGVKIAKGLMTQYYHTTATIRLYTAIYCSFSPISLK